MGKKKKDKTEQIARTEYKKEDFIKQNTKNIKDLIAPAGINAGNVNHV